MSAPTPTITTPRAVPEAVGRLSDEFVGTHSRGVVVEVVLTCHRDLSGVPAGALPELLERLARQRLLVSRPAHH